MNGRKDATMRIWPKTPQSVFFAGFFPERGFAGFPTSMKNAAKNLRSRIKLGAQNCAQG